MFRVRLLVAVATLTLSVSQAFAQHVLFRTGEFTVPGQEDESVTVVLPDGFSVFGKTVLPVNVHNPLFNWATIPGTKWLTPVTRPFHPDLAGNAAFGEYVYEFNFSIRFEPDPKNSNELNPLARLRFDYYADNTVCRIQLREHGASTFFDISASSATQNQLGVAEINLGFLPFPIAFVGNNVNARVTVVNIDPGAPPPPPFNPTGPPQRHSIQRD